MVTGANRGIGLEVCRQLAANDFTVILTARDHERGAEAARDLGVDFQQLDVARDDSVRNAIGEIEKRHGGIGVLVNNAAIHYDTWQRGAQADLDVVREALDTNLFGAWRTSLAAIPLMRRDAWGRIVNVSSQGGSLASMSGGTPAYSVSKAALNALTRIIAAEVRRDGILVKLIPFALAGSRPIWEGRGVDPWQTAPRASRGRFSCPMTDPAEGSSETGDLSHGEPER